MRENISIAVLPFVNFSKDPENEYFSDGITEEIINALTYIEGMKVIARTSSFNYKGKNIDIRKIGQELQVGTILEGSVRKANNRVRITAQLIDVSDGTHYWSKNFDRELLDVFQLQDEVSLLIAEEVRNNFGYFEIQNNLVTEPTKSIDAYDFFLKGRFEQLKWSPESLKKAIEYYDRAISLDDQYAKAYYANLQCYGLLAMWGYIPVQEGLEKAGENFLKGQALDVTLPEYPLSIVGRFFWGEWNYELAHQYILKVLEVNPNHIDGLEAMAELYLLHGYFEETESYTKRLLELDPISKNNLYTHAHTFYNQKKYSKSIHFLNEALVLDPHFPIAHHLRVLCLILMNDFDTLKKSYQESPEWDLYQQLYQCIHIESIELSQDELSEWMQADENISEITPFHLYILANSDYHQEAFVLLKKYIEKRRGQVINYRVNPMFEKLKKIKDFESLHSSSLQKESVKVFRKEDKYTKKIIDTHEEGRLEQALVSFFEKEEPYLNADLNLTTVAETLETTTNKLSYLINEVLGVNFNEFINGYRHEYFKKIAILPENSHITLLGLAFESGYNSKSVFNTFFKKKENMSPSQWVKSHK
ncbi:MAG: helix-turn-helix domain-containing protein [Flavobacteriales bacterium]|jgi:TolB-like protein/AraC-like DNA-binding protein|nr:helix-turn-helix domain-containing protein [Flavobacteriales bacterium]